MSEETNLQENQNKEAMDSVDHAWLRMEGPHNLMMIGVVLIFEDRLDLDRFYDILQTRLIDRFERFSQRVVHENGHDYWQEDPYFSLDNHVIATAFPHTGSKEQLQTLASEIVSQPLENDKPLWSIHVIGHYQQGSALVIRIHHCIADGMSLVKLIMSLTDPSADPQSKQLCMEKPTEGAGSHHHESLRDLMAHPSHLIESMSHGLSGAEELAAITLRAGDPKTSLKGELSGKKTAAWADPFPLPAVKKLGKQLNATVNDVLMTVATGVLKNLLEQKSEDTDGKTLHAAVPFNLRPIDEPIDKLGNQFGLVLVPLPVGIEDPTDRLKAVSEGMQKLKNSYQAHVFFFLLQVLGKGPSFLEQTALDVLSKKASVVMTNVPGPKVPLYLAGAKLAQPLAWVPQSGDIGIGLSILSYNDQVQFGFIADRNLIEDASNICQLFLDEFKLLEAAVNNNLQTDSEVN
ncbi:MAG: wax ester/triacylglycerol synthase family O-acyltransferase [Pseudomonadales bacterium]|nr:wax ester/triacylglycerol synthase family O-acyltransferase [Pseudomonadales bacterium]